MRPKPPPKTYQKYKPKEGSFFHDLNRGYNQWDLYKKGAGMWGKILKYSWNPFEIKDYAWERKKWQGKQSENDRLFE